MRVLLDSNIVISVLLGKTRLDKPTDEYYISTITEIEVFSYPNLSSSEEEAIRSMLGEMNIVQLSREVKETTIRLRKKHRLTVPDAIIAASALVIGAELWTNDAKLLKIPEIQSTSLPPLGS